MLTYKIDVIIDDTEDIVPKYYAFSLPFLPAYNEQDEHFT